ncbi:deoxynucleoside kinase [Patescibacteria group bacterium]|nr:deoxynucleoside kinase [Patescibacteria group bacterium]MBU4078379.1 deoxynucleoside kinase [Patescibacteria group bacterium]
MKGDRTMILLEGIIAAGKSTIGRRLAKSELFDFIEEPVTLWRNFPLPGGETVNLLDWFYEDMERAAYTFQTAAFITRAKNWAEVLAKTDHSQVILERSVFCDYNVFAFNCYRSGDMSPKEHMLYRQLWALAIMQGKIDTPDLFVFYDTASEECMERMPERERDEEIKKIQLQYLKRLEVLHKQWLINDDGCAPLLVLSDGFLRQGDPLSEELDASKIRVPVLRLDGNREWQTDELIEAIQSKLPVTSRLLL